MNNKKLTVLILTVTIILAGVAMFIGFKLYQLGQVPGEILPPEKKTPEIYQQDEAFPCQVTFTVSEPSSKCYKSCSQNSDCNPVASTGGELICGSYPCPPGQGCPDVMGCYNSSCPYEQDCVCSTVTPTPTGSPTPTPPLGCDKTCSSDGDCDGGYICYEASSGDKRCRNSNCTGEGDCACNRSCWEVCGTDSECPSGLSCRQIDQYKRCVDPDCQTDSDCNCLNPTATPTITTTTATTSGQTLPLAGSSWPTIFLGIGGILLAILGVVLI